MTEVPVVEHITVTGVVQGVGFRPFVHRLATELELNGSVGNDSTQVIIDVAGTLDRVDAFVERLTADAPPLAHIESVSRESLGPDTLGSNDGESSSPIAIDRGFSIVASATVEGERTLVSPDTAPCADCLSEFFDPRDRRFRHPFITCTNCGPRFTIIQALPYDRPNTTMAGFEMCSACRSEYEDPTDRRFHAQPIACHRCGPRLWFRSLRWADTVIKSLTDDPIGRTRRAIDRGDTVAIKGTGGYNLACDATDDEAVARLRERKHRPDKPLAVMAASVEAARELAFVSDDEAGLLTSAAAPIVLLAARPDSPLSPLVSQGNPLIGVMLPNTPIHHLLFPRHRLSPDGARHDSHRGPLVMTSANRSGEPIAHTPSRLARLGDLYDGVLDHDRPIETPCDDSVVRIVDGRLLPIRRSRGYAPLPVSLSSGLPSVLAVGAEIKNTFCITNGHHAWVSPHIGDMENLETLDAFEKMVGRFSELYDIDPSVVAVDEHPGYLVSRWGRSHHPDHVVGVQHHHAHLASVMAEHHLDPDQPLLGFTFDGTGYGTDGTIWGGEVLEVTASEARRTGWLTPVLLPGGDAGVEHTARTALAYLHSCGLLWDDRLPSVQAVTAQERQLLRQQLVRGVACVPSSSMGRLFDAVASLVGLRHEISYEAQAAIELEAAADRGHTAGRWRAALTDSYRFEVRPDGEIRVWPVLHAIVRDVLASVPPESVAWRFHDAVAEIVHRIAVQHRARTGSNHVALSGGTFQNALLTKMCIERLEASGLIVFTQTAVPPNDGGLALGQAFIAAHRLRGG